MRKINYFIAIFLCLAFTSCNDDDPTLLAVESKSMSNLHAPQTGGQGQPVGGDFTKFDFTTGSITISDTDWDIAFRGTTIIVNGGTSSGLTDEPTRNGDAAAYVISGTLASITSVSTSELKQDSTNGLAIASGSGNGWYTYAGPPTHLIVPTAGKVLIFRTRNGRYAKVEILSYYKDAPANPDAFTDESRYFTFNYVYNPNEGITTF